MRHLAQIIVPLLAAFMAFAAPAHAQQSKFFGQPSFSGIPVDHCVRFGQQCGEEGANLFCQNAGFDKAASWDTTRADPTYVIGESQRCVNRNCTALSNVTCVNQSNAVRAGERVFDFPNIRGYAVDHCANFGENCGRGGADLFCQRRGFDSAIRWDTFSAGQTFVLGANQACTTGNCTGFSTVTCGRAAAYTPAPVTPVAPRGKRYDSPRARGAAVDRCVSFGKNCGRDGADLFCQGEGFARAESWDTFTPGRTFVLGSKEYCNGPECTGFSQVTCDREAYVPPQPAAPIVPVAAPDRTFEYPSVSGLVVDHCVTFGENCGRGGADLLCRSQGFKAASNWTTFPAGQTFVLGSRAACTTGNCTGLSSVTCSNNDSATYLPAPQPITPRPGPAQTFSFPKFDGLPVDHCETFGSNCGRGGAQTFCESAGFQTATNWTTYNAGRSFVIGSGRACTSGNCTAFAEVTCSGSVVYRPERADNDQRRGGNRDRGRGRKVGHNRDKKPSGKSRRFVFPQMEGLSVDHCARAGVRCGQGGANRYCETQGFRGATSWLTYSSGETIYPGSRRRCTGSRCTGLAEVQCQ